MGEAGDRLAFGAVVAAGPAPPPGCTRCLGVATVARTVSRALPTARDSARSARVPLLACDGDMDGACCVSSPSPGDALAPLERCEMCCCRCCCCFDGPLLEVWGCWGCVPPTRRAAILPFGGGATLPLPFWASFSSSAPRPRAFSAHLRCSSSSLFSNSMWMMRERPVISWTKSSSWAIRASFDAAAASSSSQRRFSSSCASCSLTRLAFADAIFGEREASAANRASTSSSVGWTLPASSAALAPSP